MFQPWKRHKNISDKTRALLAPGRKKPCASYNEHEWGCLFSYSTLLRSRQCNNDRIVQPLNKNSYVPFFEYVLCCICIDNAKDLCVLVSKLNYDREANHRKLGYLRARIGRPLQKRVLFCYDWTSSAVATWHLFLQNSTHMYNVILNQNAQPARQPLPNRLQSPQQQLSQSILLLPKTPAKLLGFHDFMSIVQIMKWWKWSSVHFSHSSDFMMPPIDYNVIANFYAILVG